MMAKNLRQQWRKHQKKIMEYIELAYQHNMSIKLLVGDDIDDLDQPVAMTNEVLHIAKKTIARIWKGL